MGKGCSQPCGPMGAAAEKAMFPTGNVNTHKGIIFSLGLVTSFTLWLIGPHRYPWTAKKTCLPLEKR